MCHKVVELRLFTPGVMGVRALVAGLTRSARSARLPEPIVGWGLGLGLRPGLRLGRSVGLRPRLGLRLGLGLGFGLGLGLGVMAAVGSSACVLAAAAQTEAEPGTERVGAGLGANETAGPALAGEAVEQVAGQVAGNAAGQASGQVAGQAEPLIQEDFNSVADGSIPAGWKVVEGEWRVENGRLIGQSPAWVQGRIVFGDPNWMDYEVSVDVSFLRANDPTRWAALMYRTPATGAYPYYLFTVRNNMMANNGTEVARRAVSGNWEVMATRAAGKRVPDRQTFNLRVQVVGNSVRYFFDGEKVHEMAGVVQNVRGLVGLHVNGATVAFDNVVVRPLSEEDVPGLVQVAGIVPPARQTKTAVLSHLTPVVIAHRGASKEAPENTMAAFRRAIELGADLVECDVYLSSDGVPVLLHDGTLDRTSNGKGSVTSLTLEQIKKLDAGAWKGARYVGEPIPTLAELLELAKGKAQVLIEIKQAGQATVAATVAAVRKAGMSSNVVIQSFNAESVRLAAQLAPDVPRALLLGDLGIRNAGAGGAIIAKQVLESGANAASVNYGAVRANPELVRYLHARGIAVFVWTVDDQTALQQMVLAGVDGIITNDPATLSKVIEAQ